MRRDADSGVWSLGLRGGLAKQTCTLLVDVFVRGHGLVRNRVTDPCSLSLDADSRHSWIGAPTPPMRRCASRPPWTQGAGASMCPCAAPWSL